MERVIDYDMCMSVSVWVKVSDILYVNMLDVDS